MRFRRKSILFCQECYSLCNAIIKKVSLLEQGKQVIHASSAVGANYIEANEALRKKDFIVRIKTCRKEATELKKNFSLLF